MPNRRPFSKALAVTAAAVAGILLVGWVIFDAIFGPPVIRIVNLSDESLSEIRVSEGWHRDVKDVAAHSEIEFIQHVRGEAGPTLTFSAGGKRFNQPLGYIEESGGYWATVTILPDMRIETSGGLGRFKFKRAL